MHPPYQGMVSTYSGGKLAKTLIVKNQAFKDGKFVEVTERDIEGKWSVFFYPADFTFVCPTELGDVADHYAEFKKLGVERRRNLLRVHRHPFHAQNLAQQL